MESRMTIKSKRTKLVAMAATWIFLIPALSPAAEPAPSAATTPAAPMPAAPTPNVLTSNKDLENLLAPIREKHKVPGLVAGIIQGEGLTIVAAVGVRKAGSPDPIT